MNLIEIYTDGSSRGNPGPGGYGVVMSYKRNEKEISQGFRKTTNNRMELLAVIVAIESLKTKDIPVKVYSDSKYVIDSITKGWLDSWIMKKFKGSGAWNLPVIKNQKYLGFISKSKLLTAYRNKLIELTNS